MKKKAMLSGLPKHSESRASVPEVARRRSGCQLHNFWKVSRWSDDEGVSRNLHRLTHRFYRINWHGGGLEGSSLPLTGAQLCVRAAI